jgi:DNA adenine methylase
VESPQPQRFTKPFLKWPGGKFRLIERLMGLLGDTSQGTYFEPFAGGASMGLNVKAKQKVIGDININLINLYQHVLYEDEFIEFAKQFFVPDNNREEAFYKLRDELNTTDDKKVKAALTLYVNKHCFNGLMRENSSGAFNTPFGSYKRVTFPKTDLLAFKQTMAGAKFINGHFSDVLNTCQPGDAVYCDPPYVPKSETANFTSYSMTKFGEKEQVELAQLAESLRDKGVKVMISNHDTPFTQEIYKNAAEIHTFPVKRSISCVGNKRHDVAELVAVYK